MKKIICSLLVTAALLCTGCSGKNASGSSNDHEASDGSYSSSLDTSLKGDIFLKSGIWSVVDDEIPYGYYILKENGEGGERIAYQDGKAVNFTYALYEDKATFHFGSHLEKRNYTVKSISDDKLELEFFNGDIIVLTYLSAGTIEDISFHSNEELAELALAYYASGDPRDASDDAYGQTLKDGTVKISVYFNRNNDTSTYTAAEYIVDRETAAIITEGTQEAVNLLDFEAKETVDTENKPQTTTN